MTRGLRAAATAVILMVVAAPAASAWASGAQTPRAAAAPTTTAPPTTATTVTTATPPPAGITLPAGPGAAPGTTPTYSQPLSGRAKAGAVLGGLLLIGLLFAFSQGYGILGGRSRRQEGA
jgi:hypothetical protein